MERNQTAHHERGAENEHDGEGDLAGDEHAPQSWTRLACHRATAAPQRVRKTEMTKLERGRDAEEQSRQDGYAKRDREYAPLEPESGGRQDARRHERG